MADNFNVKQFLAENKLGPYSKIKEGEAAYEYEKGKAAGEKEEKEKLTKEDYAGAEEEKMMDFLAEYEVIYVYGNDGKCYRKDDEGNYDQVDSYYCKRFAGTGVREEKEKEESFGGINEDILSPEAYERMAGLSNLKAQQAMVKAAEIMMDELTAEGFEVEEVREFFHKLIANDI